jgi:hypothetical protein
METENHGRRVFVLKIRNGHLGSAMIVPSTETYPGISVITCSARRSKNYEPNLQICPQQGLIFEEIFARKFVAQWNGILIHEPS